MSRLYWSVFETNFGWVVLIGSEGKLVGVKLTRITRQAAIEGIPAGAEESHERFGTLPEQMKRYFAGERVTFDCDVEFNGLGAFEKQVLEETRKVPYGIITTYGSLASLAGRPGAARAVGNAMRKNPLPIIIPCHRVVHSDGSLGGFATGLEMKRRLLSLEGVEV